MQSIIKKIVWISLAIIPFIALYVADGGTFDILSRGTAGMYFPFISGKNIVFRALVEIAFAGWVILALYDSKYRINLKESPLTIAYGIFIIILFIADIFGVDPMRSIWSNFERMEGFVAHIHFFVYFFVLVAMLHTKEDWQKMFKIFIGSNIVVLVYAYGQLLGAKGYIFANNFPNIASWFSAKFPIHMSQNRLDATIGNSAYFAIFCLMYVCISALLWSQSKEPKKAWLYPLLIVLNLVALFYSGTRGTIIGLVVGAFFTLGIIAWYEKGRIRKIFFGVLVAAIILTASLFIFKDSQFIKSSPTLARLAAISPTEITSGSRIAMWTISYDAWLENPVLGYGQDNFSHVFARKFLADRMYNLEAWYDRSHNVFFDWLIAGGILGLLSYLSLYFVALHLVWRKKHEMPLREKAIITGALAGYFVHNVFVFDNLTSYILFFALLAYIVAKTKDEHHTHKKQYQATDDQMNLLWMPIVGLLLLVVLYYISYRPLQVNKLLIKGMSFNRLSQEMPFAEAVKIGESSFKKAMALNTLGSEETREQFLQMGVSLARVTIPPETPEVDKKAIGESINNFIKSIRDDISSSYESNKEDVRMLALYGMFYNGTGDSASAEKVLLQAHNLAPKKQLISFDLIRAYLIQGKYSEAYALSRETYDSQPLYEEAKKWYLISAVYAKSYKEARDHVVSKGGKILLDVDVLSTAASTGQTQLALEILFEAKKTNPEQGEQIDAYIKQLLTSIKK